jgi:hypothetical protein
MLLDDACSVIIIICALPRTREEKSRIQMEKFGKKPSNKRK